MCMFNKKSLEELSTKKLAWAKKHYVTVREVTQADYDHMESLPNNRLTDYMCDSNYIIEYNGYERFSIKVTYEDMRDAIEHGSKNRSGRGVNYLDSDELYNYFINNADKFGYDKQYIADNACDFDRDYITYLEEFNEQIYEESYGDGWNIDYMYKILVAPKLNLVALVRWDLAGDFTLELASYKYLSDLKFFIEHAKYVIYCLETEGSY